MALGWNLVTLCIVLTIHELIFYCINLTITTVLHVIFTLQNSNFFVIVFPLDIHRHYTKQRSSIHPILSVPLVLFTRMT
jgi:hypothetical protein